VQKNQLDSFSRFDRTPRCGARVFAANVCVTAPANQIGNRYSYGYNDDVGVECHEHYANGPITIAIRARFEYDSSVIQHPTRSYVLSSNNEHVNSFALL